MLTLNRFLGLPFPWLRLSILGAVTYELPAATIAANAVGAGVTETITERKTEMIRRGDAFIAFPGGTGTLEEIAEVMSKVSLKQLDAPCILYNLNGYYNGLKTLLDHMIETGLSTKERQEGIWFAENLEQIKQILKA